MTITVISLFVVFIGSGGILYVGAAEFSMLCLHLPFSAIT